MERAPGTADDPARFLVIMEHGRTGSTWLSELLESHPQITSIGEQLGDRAAGFSPEDGAHRASRFFERLDVPLEGKAGAWQKLPPTSTVLGAKQAWPRWREVEKRAAHLANQGNVSRSLPATLSSLRVICLARTNPAEAIVAQINGDAHQAACAGHVFAAHSNCSWQEPT